MKRRYIFGPVASRRLGMSLGIDLTPHKTCSFNCVYCESGETTALASERREYVPIDMVTAQLDDFLCADPKVDYLTFSGAGEPTLNSGIGRVVKFLKDKYPQYRICLLTNGSLLGDPQVRRDIALIDLVVPSLDASCGAEFEKINRAADGISFEPFIEELIAYCAETSATVWLEIFIVPGVNDSDKSIERFVSIVRNCAPAKVQLNTLDRPGCVDWIAPSSPENTMRFINALEPFVPVEAVGPFKYKSAALRRELKLEDIDRQIIELVSRRPSTCEDMAEAFGLAESTVKARLSALLDSGGVQSVRRDRGEFFSVDLR